MQLERVAGPANGGEARQWGRKPSCLLQCTTRLPPRRGALAPPPSLSLSLSERLLTRQSRVDARSETTHTAAMVFPVSRGH